MGTIAQELTRIQGAKSDLATSIANKGVTVPAATKIDGYAALVDQIQAGSGSNPFNDSDFSYLLYKGRFLDNLDDIYNSTRANLTSWDFKYMCDGVRNINQTKMQKIFDIVGKFSGGGNATAIDYQYCFSNISLSDNLNILTFAPTINISGNLNLAYMFYNFGVPTGKTMDLTIDFDDVICRTLSGSSIFNIQYARNSFRVLNFPISYLTSSMQFGNNYTGYTGALKEITVKGALGTGINIDVRSATQMSITNYINFFNSFDTTASTNSKIIIPSAIYDQLTEDQKAIVTDKGYLLATS